MSILWFSRLKTSVVWVFVRYAIVIIGFIRSIIIANILTVNEMGQLALVYLIIEYATILIPFGSTNSLNQQLSKLKSEKKDLTFNNDVSLRIYSTVFWILIATFLIFLLFMYLINIYMNDFIALQVRENSLILSLIIIFSIIKSFAIVHIRMWDKWSRIIYSEIAHALIYLFGVYLYLQTGDDISIIFYSLFLSIIVSILIIRFNIFNYKFFSFFSLKNIHRTGSIGFFLMINLIMETLFWGIDRFFIAIYLPSEELANFHIIHTYARAVLMFYAAITFLFTPLLYTHFNDLKNDRKKLLSKLKKITIFSETILVLSAIISATVMPYIISFFMPAYANLDNLYFIVIMGLVLKNLAFFPMAYIVAVGLHRYLPIYSLTLIIFLVTSYFIAYSLFGLSSATSYSSVAVICFMFFIVLTSIHVIGFSSLKDYLLLIYEIYGKIFIIITLSIIVISLNDIFSQISNVQLCILFTLLLYFKNLINLTWSILPLLKGEKDKFLRIFQ